MKSTWVPHIQLSTALETSHPKTQKWQIEDIASWMKAFSISTCSSWCGTFTLLERSQPVPAAYFAHVPPIRRQSLAFWEHTAATSSSDWSCINMLFNFQAAGSSVCSSTMPPSNEFVEPPGPSSLVIMCISWNKGRCTAPYALCRYTHRCSIRLRPAPVTHTKSKYEDSKCHCGSSAALDALSRSKVRRV